MRALPTTPRLPAWVVHRLADLPFTFTAHANDVFVRPGRLRTQAHRHAVRRHGL